MYEYFLSVLKLILLQQTFLRWNLSYLKTAASTWIRTTVKRLPVACSLIRPIWKLKLRQRSFHRQGIKLPSKWVDYLSRGLKFWLPSGKACHIIFCQCNVLMAVCIQRTNCVSTNYTSEIFLRLSVYTRKKRVSRPIHQTYSSSRLVRLIDALNEQI